MPEIIILLTVTFLNNELDDITESSIISVVCQTCEPDINVLNSVELFSVEFAAAVFVNNELSNIIDVVTSEFISVESFMLEVVEFESVIVESPIMEFASIAESFITE